MSDDKRRDDEQDDHQQADLLEEYGLDVVPESLDEPVGPVRGGVATCITVGPAMTQTIIARKLDAGAARNALGSGIKWDTCEPAMSISFGISFVAQGTFYGTLWGKAVT